MSAILLDSFKKNIIKQKLFHENDILLLAVSGGVDSVVLCELCALAGYKFIIAHCNFQLRGEESHIDEAFVKTLADKYNTKVLVKRFDTEKYRDLKNCSIQVAARELRYEWFNKIIETDNENKNNSQHPKYILTAHHADDNIETVLMNLFKGTGIAGLRGILPKTGKLLRPLLFVYKKELLAFAEENNLPFREDSSNASDKYSRNYIRHNIIPAIEVLYPQASTNINKTITHLTDAETLYRQAIEHNKKAA